MLDETEVRRVSACHGTSGRKPHTKISNELFGVIVYESAFFNSQLYCRKIGIGEHHVRSQFGHIGPAPHCDTNICFLQCRRIINTIWKKNVSIQKTIDI